MGDWMELGQAVFFGVILSFIVAKLISVVVSLNEDRLTGAADQSVQPTSGASEVAKPRVLEEDAGVSVKEASLRGESDGDDDWEGIESTELDEAFSAATTFVAAAAADRMASKVSNELQLQLYGLYKVAIEGPCTTPQPSAIKMTARAKWNAWQKLGDMPPEEAMQKYIMLVTELYPNWAGNSSSARDEGAVGSASSSDKGHMGPVFSSFIYEEEVDNDLKLDAIHVSAREGKMEDLLSCIENGVSINLRDSEERTPLHWAVDRGHFDVVEILIHRSADVNAEDHEGQTPLHYAVLCEREAIAKLLVEHNANLNLKDKDGNTPGDLLGSSWVFMSSPN
ncbi:LOW QUALITY PROTEIN: acyl-CoA-binding domain-containing protein 1-like [Dioscorea cayenensis subsp. rotundata]|uniref:LOW QUALITY PROTEIN: acyl-CoA-binding domain-containing protein 1-like n=1 Tax=Dioscorea cayennensis subsp. rotundata TaxID=55577 RepID=A0AB40C4B0_DIOCR|nr:LOW QUALITY PROTEIN: acyl-CoA-binding domain-containing protein 1-like [Dioscorea cayenensis subsp. rotundata]